jgi:hypothetical protein
MGKIRGTVHPCIPEHIAIQLQLREQEQRNDELGWRSKECMEACPLEWGAG